MNRLSHSSATQQSERRGLLFGLGAYGLWGVIPIYFKALAAVPALDIVAHRVLWSVPFIALLLTWAAGWREVRQALADRRTLSLLMVTALMIAVNWLLYVYAVVSGHILAGSLGYYLSPLVNVLLGRLVLKERLTVLQWAAVAIAAAGICALAIGAAGQLWISLSLGVSFGLYGLLRKVAPVDAVAGLAIETLLLFPFAAAWLVIAFISGAPSFGSTPSQSALLVLAGVITTIPLLLFTGAARRLRYSTLGMLQFIAPTLQFLIAVLLYGEAFTTAHAIAFGAIWIALVLYGLALARQAQAAVTIPDLGTAGVLGHCSYVKRIALAAALLLLASCETAGYAPQGSQPYPSAPPGQAYPAPPPAECPISASQDWAAWINAMPGPNARPTLIVTGKVVTPTGGYQVSIDPDLRIAESYPAQAFVELRVTPPVGGAATQALVTHQLRWEWPANQPIGSVTVRCGEKHLARISPVQTAS